MEKGVSGRVSCLYQTHSPGLETNRQQNLPSALNLGTRIRAVKEEKGAGGADVIGMHGPVCGGPTRLL